ncbi:uncharacterized protein LOC131230767 [Magnolia sinica]|uniref:uncharacterized protein LOC131230767 n=1 Tax=Magnolia sinica TaxID=86752 RepID=UPI002658D8F0|nr:uncharacterized protein LOC131230767 [Magnolia sinica]
MEDQKQILKAVFGESSSDTEDENERSDFIHTHGEKNPSWERVKEIDGLWLCSDFLSPERQSSLLSSIQREGWFTEASHNQAMRFGDLPEWAMELSGFIREAVFCSEFFSELCEETIPKQDDAEACPLASDLLWREPLFDQLIVNVYQPGEGICGHVDLMRFDDGIAIISLESACVMHFTRVEREAHGDENGEEEKEGSLTRKVPVFLSPGSLVLMSGEARYLWKHEINRKRGFQVWEGQEIHQLRRTSVTLRKLCQPK